MWSATSTCKLHLVEQSMVCHRDVKRRHTLEAEARKLRLRPNTWGRGRGRGQNLEVMWSATSTSTLYPTSTVIVLLSHTPALLKEVVLYQKIWHGKFKNEMTDDLILAGYIHAKWRCVLFVLIQWMHEIHTVALVRVGFRVNNNKMK